MSEITPRWEWRTFGADFGEAEAVLAGLEPTGAQDSDEIYFLNAVGANVKVRDDLMDIKALLAVDADGLEQWTPILKQAFPLQPADIAKVLEKLQAPVSVQFREPCTLQAFTAAFAGTGVRPLKVRKHRVRYRVNGCTGELTSLTAAGRSTRTIALESEDPAVVLRAREALGLSGVPNTNYPRGLAALIDGMPTRYAVIDVGTNSVKFHIAERDADGRWRTVVDRAEISQLGEGINRTGSIGEAALGRTIEAIAAMAEEAARLGAFATAAVGTAGLRLAANREQAVAAIEARTGLRVEVISGEEESRLAFLAARSGLGLKTGSLAVFDTGGGSSQFTFGHDDVVDEQFSVNVGAVRFTERFGLDGPVSPQDLQAAKAAIAADLAALDGRPVPGALAAMGGAITNLAAVSHGLAKYDPEVVQGTVLTAAEVDRQIELYRSTDAAGRRAVVGLQPKRAEVILAGACIVATIMEKLGKTSLTVSDRGLRHGVLAHWFGD